MDKRVEAVRAALLRAPDQAWDEIKSNLVALYVVEAADAADSEHVRVPRGLASSALGVFEVESMDEEWKELYDILYPQRDPGTSSP